MSYFKMFEDPMYDDDGQLVDEDSDEGDWQEMPSEEEVNNMAATYSPYDTVNS